MSFTNLELILTGKTKTHLFFLDDENKWIHQGMVKDYLALQKAAQREGFTLRLASAFRDFETQLRIWNEKASGKRKLLSREEAILDIQNLSEKELIYSILIWSQLPGASRHHWGTDIDVFDNASCPDGYQVALTRNEVESGGIFFLFHEWLDKHLPSFNFFRPYRTDKGGIQPERWHLSYAPLANDFQRKYSLDLLERTIRESNILLKDFLLPELPLIYQQYITNLDS